MANSHLFIMIMLFGIAPRLIQIIDAVNFVHALFIHETVLA